MVIWGRCSTYEVPPYWPWIQIIRQCAESESGHIAKEGVEVCRLLESREARDPQERFRLFDRVANFLAKVAASRPLLLIIDNLELADEISLSFLGFVAREISDAALLGFIIYRITKLNLARPCDQLLKDVTLRLTRRISLSALTQSEVAELIERSCGSNAAVVAEIYQRTGGNPMFTEILL